MKLLLCLCFLVLPNLGLLLETDEQSDSPPLAIVHPKDRKLPPGRIIGGDEVVPHSYPFQVGLYINTEIGSRFFCGGTLIRTDWVMTAAHCLDMLRITNVQVYLGSHHITEAQEQNRTVLNSTQFIIHPNWNESLLQNDIALLRLPVNVTLSEHIGLVQFARGNSTYVDQRSTMVGWGLTESSNSLSPVLRSVNSTILSNADCNYGIYQEVIVPTHVCASGVGPIGTCNGDSGGPLLVNGVQVGITSFGVTGCVAQYPSVFTRITAYENWIIQYVGENGSESYNKLQYSMLVSVVVCLYQLFIYS